MLDVYCPDSDSINRPVLMFIHGGGFKGGIKHKPEIVEMANYYASRGWVYISIDYRTTEELGNIDDMSQKEIIDYYQALLLRNGSNIRSRELSPEMIFSVRLLCTLHKEIPKPLLDGL